MIEAIIQGAVMNLPQEQKAQIKSAFSKVNEFMPMIDMYHSNLPLKKDELRVAYLLSIENGKIWLRQVILGADMETKKVIISRTLSETEVLTKATELLNMF